MPFENNVTISDEWFTNDDKTFTITIFQSDGTTVQNITGWALEYVLTLKGEFDALLTKATGGSGIVITDASNGVCQVTIDAVDTLPLEGGNVPLYDYELTRTDSGSKGLLTFGTAILRQGKNLA